MNQLDGPWDRQPGESHQAYAAFLRYLDLGPTRSLSVVGQRLDKSGTLLSRWSARWHWQDRTVAYDSEIRRRALDAEAEARREMLDRHARTDVLLHNKLIQRLVGDEPHGIKPIDVNALTWSDIGRLIDIAQKLERLARGESTENVADVTKLRREAAALATARGLPVDKVLAALEHCI